MYLKAKIVQNACELVGKVEMVSLSRAVDLHVGRRRAQIARDVAIPFLIPNEGPELLGPIVDVNRDEVEASRFGGRGLEGNALDVLNPFTSDLGYPPVIVHMFMAGNDDVGMLFEVLGQDAGVGGFHPVIGMMKHGDHEIVRLRSLGGKWVCGTKRVPWVSWREEHQAVFRHIIKMDVSRMLSS